VLMSAHHLADAHEGVTHELELAQGQVRYCGPLRAPVPVRRMTGAAQ
jgi:hypothetical protein